MGKSRKNHDQAANDEGVNTLSQTPETLSLAWSRESVSVPQTIGNVRIGEEIGRGGMGIVHHGWDTVLHRTVAVKFLLAISTPENKQPLDRFFGGARAEAAVKHPNIVTVYEAGEINGVPFLIMEYIDGPSLRSIIKPNTPLPRSVAVSVLWNVAEAVAVLHQREIVHCDLKPGNVLFDRDGHLLVTDFGLASLRKKSDVAGSAVGTPAYMAPEMFKGKTSPQSDVYAMGIMLFELLAGHRPFTGDLQALHDAHRQASLPVEQLPNTTPEPLIDLLERGAHKKEVFRFKRAEHFQRALRDSGVTDELLASGAAELKEIVSKRYEQEPMDRPTETTKEPSTTTYFDRLGELADKKRTTGESPFQAEPVTVEPASGDRPTPSITPEVEAPCEPNPVGVIDLQISRHANIASRFIGVFVGVGLVFVLVLARRTGLLMSMPAHPLVFGVVFAAAIFVSARLTRLLWRPRIRARTRDIVTRFKERPIKDLVGCLFGDHGRFLERICLKMMVRVLAEKGRVGVTIRSGPPELATTIDPIAVTFEPRLLDEADTATVELQESLDSTTPTEATIVTQEDMANRLASRRVARNIRMAGGWLLFAIFGLQFILAAIESIQTWRINIALVMWSLGLGVMIFGVFRPRLSGWRVQWLAVPGGVIVRKADLLGRRWSLHLFDRRRSALVVHRLTRNQSYVCVADGESHHIGVASPREVVFLLRAWLSPIPPPHVERLTDLL